MAAPERVPGVAKAPARKPRPKICGALAVHEGEWTVDWLNDEGHCRDCAKALERLGRDSKRQDARKAIKLTTTDAHGVRLECFAEKERWIAFATVKHYQAAIALADLPPAEKKWFLLMLEQTDGRTWISYRHRKYLVEKAKTGKDRARVMTTRFVKAGIWRRIELKRGDPRLVEGTAEHREGCWLIEWLLLPGPALDAALSGMFSGHGG